MIKGKNILITGGAGFIGSHLVDALVENNNVTVYDDFSSGKYENIKHLDQHGNFTLIKDSVLNFENLLKACKGVDMVFHLAVQCIRLSIEKPFENHEVNATGSLYVCEAARRYGVKRLIYVSSSEVYGTAISEKMSESDPCIPTTVYGGAKLAGEAYARAYYRTYGLETIIVRPFNTYGPREHYEGVFGEVIPKFLIRIMNGLQPIIQGDGLQTRDFTYVTDTINGIIRASICNNLIGDAVNIAAGEELTIRDIAQIISEVTGIAIQPIFQSERPGDVRRHYADITRAENILNYKPMIKIRDGIRMYYEWLTASHNVKSLIKEEKERNWVLK